MGLSQTGQGFLQGEELREFVRRSYAEHCVHSSLPAGTPPHRAGLYGALAESYLQRGNPARELVLWMELTPFLLMAEETACAALAEYIVYQLEPQDAHVGWLTQVVSAALRVSPSAKDSPRAMAPLAIMKDVAWRNLLEADVRYTIEKETEQICKALADSKLPLTKD
jgi:hypothetical protein